MKPKPITTALNTMRRVAIATFNKLKVAFQASITAGMDVESKKGRLNAMSGGTGSALHDRYAKESLVEAVAGIRHVLDKTPEI